MAVPVVGASKYEADPGPRVAAAVTVITPRRDPQLRLAYARRGARHPCPVCHQLRPSVFLSACGFSLAGDYMTRVLVTIDGVRVNEPMYDGAPSAACCRSTWTWSGASNSSRPGWRDRRPERHVRRGQRDHPQRARRSTAASFSASWQWPQATRKARVKSASASTTSLKPMVSAAILRSDGDDLWMDWQWRGRGTVRYGTASATGSSTSARPAARGPSVSPTATAARTTPPPCSAPTSLRLRHLPGQPSTPSPTWLPAPRCPTPCRCRHAPSWATTATRRSRCTWPAYDYPASAARHGAELRLVSTALAAHTLMVGAEYQRNQRIDQNIPHPDAGDPA